jgi:signal transduction histidine kinase/CheY-like chemotaxis protein
MTRACWHILLIEDSADDCADLRQMLLRGSSRRYRFSEAPLGAAGVRQVLEAVNGPVDCVLLDYVLPDMDAPEVLAALCQGAGVPPCPVVVITGRDGEDGLRLLRAGAQDYIGKRWTSPESLTRAVENAVERFVLMAERRSAQAALQHSEERHRALFNSIDEAYAVIEMMFDDRGVAADARFVQVNPAFVRHTGLSAVEGRTLGSLVPDIEPQWFETFGAVALTGVPVRMERHSPAMQRWFDVYAFRLGLEAAHQVAVLFKDTSERKHSELALIAAKAEAERASRAKSDFLLRMSHELRSPLSAMLGYTQLIEAGTPAPTALQQDSVQHILQAGWYLLGLINEILDLTAIESGRLLLSSQVMSLSDVLDECGAMIEPQAQRAGIDVRFTGLGQPWRVHADPMRTKQVLLNLLTNAVKYNRSPGRVDVRCTEMPGGRVRVSVEDTGMGLTSAQMAQLFEPFNRLGQESGDEPGTGIGLAISKRLIELMGGCIGVDSSLGVGSCFWFELDAVQAPAARRVPAHTVLCIEQDALRPQRVEELVSRWPDVSLLRARDLRAGIEMAHSARPDVILMGIATPDPSAAQAMLLLARDPATGHIPVIALAAGAQPHDVKAGLAAGFFDYLAQPVPSDVLGRTLGLALQRTHASDPSAAAEENT